jgi:hypothetical protein
MPSADAEAKKFFVRERRRLAAFEASRLLAASIALRFNGTIKQTVRLSLV